MLSSVVILAGSNLLHFMDRLGRNKIHNPCEHAVRKENQKEKTVPKPHWFGLFVKKIKMRWVFISILEYSLSAGKKMALKSFFFCWFLTRLVSLFPKKLNFFIYVLKNLINLLNKQLRPPPHSTLWNLQKNWDLTSLNFLNQRIIKKTLGM